MRLAEQNLKQKKIKYKRREIDIGGIVGKRKESGIWEKRKKSAVWGKERKVEYGEKKGKWKNGELHGKKNMGKRKESGKRGNCMENTL